MTKELEEEGIEFADAWLETWYVGSNAKYQAMGRRDKGTELRFSFSEKKEMGIADETEMEDWKETFFHSIFNGASPQLLEQKSEQWEN